jgi:K+-sensing histidine kinase KdpD
MHAALEHDARSGNDRDLPSAVGHAVRAPLAALRASMEALARSVDAGDRRHLAARGALDEIVRLGHELQTLLDYALPLPVQPISCSLREIVCSAVEGLGPRRRAEVLTAIEDRRARLEVDGPLLSRSLTRLLEPGPGTTPAPALLHARLDSSQAVFTVVHGPTAPETAHGTDLRGTTAASVLGLLLARRDVERMGGEFTFTFRRGEEDRSVSEIRLPVLPAGALDRREAA